MTKENAQESRLLKHSTIYAIGNISRQLISFVMLPVYTRYLTPSDYGVVGLISFAIAMFETLLGAKMVQALPKFYHDQTTENQKNSVISTAFIITGLFSSVTVFFIFLFRENLADVLFKKTNLSLIVGLCGIQMLTQALEYYALMYIRLINKPISFVLVNISKLFVQLALNLYLVVYLKLGVLGVAISGLASSSIYALGLSVWTFTRIGLSFNKEIGKRMIIFSWPLWLSGLASLYIYSSNRYYIRIFDSLNNVGLYELAAKFSGILTLLIWGPFSQYWQTEQFAIVKQENARATLNSVFLFIGSLLLAAALGLSIFSDTVIRVMASPEFRGASLAVPFILSMTVLMNLTELTSVGFLASEQTSWISRNTYITAIIVTIFYCLLTPTFGFVGAAAALSAAQLVQFLIVHTTAKKKGMFHADLRPLILMSIVCVIGYICSNILFAQKDIIFDVTIKIVFFIASLIGLLLIIGRDPTAKQRLLKIIAPISERFRRPG